MRTQTRAEVGADLEAGMYYGGGEATVVNNQSRPLTSDFVSLHLKGRADGFMLKGGDATRGELETMCPGQKRRRISKSLFTTAAVRLRS